MDFEGRIRDLGEVDSTALVSAILGLDEGAWLENSYRQHAYRQHSDTESVVLVFTNTDAWPELLVEKKQGWDRLIDVAGPLMHGIIREHYPPGGTIVRAMAAKLKAGGKIRPHVDAHPSFSIAHRIHVPITTNPRVRFMIEGRPHQLKPGLAYEINNKKLHSVANRGDEDRITFIFDYVPPEQLGRVAA